MTEPRYDYLIVGAGLFGATFAWQARKAGRRALVIDRRPHLGGNVYCELTEGINVHKYGAHIFHTSDEKLWQAVNSLVPFNRYTNAPVACFKGQLYNLPFNMNTFYQMWGVKTPDEARQRIEEQRQKARLKYGDEPQNLEQQALLLVGTDIYERLIKGYTEKQWGRPCTELPAFIIRRLPVRFVFDNNYFNDRFQGIPIGGYNRLVDRLLEGTETMTGIDFLELRKQAESPFHVLGRQFQTIVYTGQIDEFFDYRLGRLEWRSVRFEHQVMDTPNYQGNAVVNFTDSETPFTRSIEHKHFEMFGQQVYDVPRTVVSREYSQEWQPGMEPYYPVNDERNNRLAEGYKELAAKAEGYLFGGRLAEYKYYDMAPVMERAMQFFT